MFQIDVPYNYLRFFLESDERLEEIRIKFVVLAVRLSTMEMTSSHLTYIGHIFSRYGSGEMLTSEVKDILVAELQKIVAKHNQVDELSFLIKCIGYSAPTVLAAALPTTLGTRCCD